MKQNVIEISNVSYSYRTKDKPVLADINLTIPELDFLGIIGPNGGGKTTLLNLMLGILKPDTGKILIKGKKRKTDSGIFGYVPQYSKIDDSFPIQVQDVLDSAVLSSNLKKQELELRREGIMEKLKIIELRNARFGSLSGGQKQRTLIGRALISNPEIILLDEPTASVDFSSEKSIYDTLKELNETKTIVLVSHDISFVSSFVKRVACLNRNIAVHDTAEIKVENVESTYHHTLEQIQHRCNL